MGEFRKRSGLNYTSDIQSNENEIEEGRTKGRMRYSKWIRVVSFIIMNSPPIRHDNSILRNKESVIPIVLDNVMIIPEFINRSPSQEFLHNQNRNRKLGDTLIMARM
jgi:hypothetical protein